LAIVHSCEPRAVGFLRTTSTEHFACKTTARDTNPKSGRLNPR